MSNDRDAVVVQSSPEPNRRELRRLVTCLRANPGVGLVGELADYEQVVSSETDRFVPRLALAVNPRERDVEHRAMGRLVIPDDGLVGTDAHFVDRTVLARLFFRLAFLTLCHKAPLKGVETFERTLHTTAALVMALWLVRVA